MNLYEYLKTLSIPDRELFAKKCGTSRAHLSLMARGHRNPGTVGPASMTIRICKASGWKIEPHELRPDVYQNRASGMALRAR